MCQHMADQLIRAREVGAHVGSLGRLHMQGQRQIVGRLPTIVGQQTHSDRQVLIGCRVGGRALGLTPRCEVEPGQFKAFGRRLDPAGAGIQMVGDIENPVLALAPEVPDSRTRPIARCIAGRRSSAMRE